MKGKLLFLLGAMLIGILSSCNYSSTQVAEDNGPTKVEWAKNANIYEVNIRQYTPEGTFKAFEQHLPRLKSMGVDILWIMPIHPVGEVKRKGSLGSYYAVKDFQKVNPEFGTLEDFKQLVEAVHQQQMKIIIDWVPNHSAWDNWMIYEHPEWYTKDSLGNIIAPVEDWSDVADLNYDNADLRKYMLESLSYWINEADIDGYRCDVAGMVPLDFWTDARATLDAIKPVFMLAEVENPEIHAAFDMTYGWEFHHIMNEIAKDEMNTENIVNYFQKIDTTYQANDYIMNFTSNHDENSWNGTVFERMGDAYKTFAVLSATTPGMPLIYSGQEAGLDKRLAFFEKDSIDWSELPMEAFYTRLLAAKHNNKALWNGTNGGKIQVLSDVVKEKVFVFTREKDNNKVVVFLNFSDTEQAIELANDELNAEYTSLFEDEAFKIENNTKITLAPFGYKVLVK